MKRRLISIFLTMLFVFNMAANVGSNVYAADSRVEAAINWAIGIANDNSHGYSQSVRWGPHYDCSSFVYAAFYQAGFNLPGSGTRYTQTMVTHFTNAGFTWIPWGQIGNMNNLQRGDILLNNSSDPKKQHTEIYLGGGNNVGAHSPSKGISVSGYYSHPWLGVLRYKNTTGNNPDAALDFVNTIPGGIEVIGWAFDRDNLSKALGIHVYVGGPAGSGAPGYVITANTYRPDINKIYSGIGEYHGFSSRISVSKRGTQPIYVYAINEGAGSNVLIGSKEVVIPEEEKRSPEAMIDSITAVPGGVQVIGWAYDKDALSTPLRIHVYVGNPTDSNASLYSITADKYRPDVGKAYPGVGDYHGFNSKISVSKRGTQPIYVYAINEGAGGNIFIGSKEVVIQGDNVNPAISDVKVTNVDGNGYTVSCKVTDNVEVDRVMFPTWTRNNGQDDLAAEWPTNKKVQGTKNGDMYAFRVNASDHNNEEGLYTTHIYAWDINGNQTAYRALADIAVDRKNPVISDVKVTNVDGNGYTVSCKVTDNIGVDRVVFPSWTRNNGQDDLGAGWNTNPKFQGTKNGDVYTFRVSASDHNNEEGLYATHIYAWDKAGNEVAYRSLGDIMVEKEHKFGEWKTTKAATCIANGSRTRTCSICGKSETQVIAATGHKMGAWTVTKDATSTLEGKKSRVCSVCKATETKTIPATGNDTDTDDKGTAPNNPSEGSTTGTKPTQPSTENASGTNPTQPSTEDADGTDPADGDEDGTDPSDEDDEEVEIPRPSDEEAPTTETKPTQPSTGEPADTQPSVPEPLKKGSLIVDEATNSVYRVTASKADGGEVEYRKPRNAGLTSIAIPTSIKKDGFTYKVTSISAKAFQNKKKLKKAVIANNVKTIGSQAFSNCKNLQKVTIGNNVTSIGAKAFYKCVKLSSVTIPKKVDKIGKYAFGSCKKLKEITIKTTKLTLKKVGTNAFQGVHKKVKVKVPKSKVDVYRKILKKRGIKF